MVDILFLPTMRETTKITATDHIHIILRHEEPLCVLKLFHEDLIVVIKIETGEIIPCEKEDFVGGEGVQLEDFLTNGEGD